MEVDQVRVFDEPIAAVCSKSCRPDGSAPRYPEKFSDPSTIVPPSSLQELVNVLHEIFESDDVCVEYVQTLMASYKSNPKEWSMFAKFDQFRYTRNLVDQGNGKFNLMILCWNEGQGSSIHSHAGSHCFLKVLDGTVREELYEWPSGERQDIKEEDGGTGTDERSTSMTRWAVKDYGRNQCTYINDSIGLHRVENSSHVNKAVSLHLYSPPFMQCKTFDERSGKESTSTMTFWSKFGKRTPFGRNPDNVTTSTVENN